MPQKCSFPKQFGEYKKKEKGKEIELLVVEFLRRLSCETGAAISSAKS